LRHQDNKLSWPPNRKTPCSYSELVTGDSGQFLTVELRRTPGEELRRAHGLLHGGEQPVVGQRLAYGLLQRGPAEVPGQDPAVGGDEERRRDRPDEVACAGPLFEAPG